MAYQMEENNHFLSLQLKSSIQMEEERPTQSHPSLHSIRKPPAKPWRKPEPPAPKMYRVEPRGFRQLVQKLTGKPPSNPRPLKDMVTVPPPLDFVSRPPTQPLQQQQTFDRQNQGGVTGLMSPSSLYSSWCSFPLLSPGSMAALES